MSTVSLLKYNNYNRDDLLECLYKSCKNILFDPANLAGAKVAIKPNLLTAATSESGVTTHPEFFRAVVHYIREHKGIPILVESPAFFNIDKVLKKCGYEEIIRTEKIPFSDPAKTAIIKNEKGIKYKYFHVAEDIVHSDFIFNLPKLKTHSLTYFTGAVKNLFGTINGLEKSKWHVKTETENEFMSFLLDLYGAFQFSKKDRIISIMDGILGLEGEGPGKSGRPVTAGAVIAGMDAIAVDTVAIAVAGLVIGKARLCIDGAKRKLGVSDINRILVVGNSLSDFNNHFIPPKNKTFTGKLPVSKLFLKNLIVKKPVPDEKKCTLCYQCKTICPAGVIEKSKRGNIPFYDYTKCIRCYCCMEICPEGAIILKRKIFT